MKSITKDNIYSVLSVSTLKMNVYNYGQRLLIALFDANVYEGNYEAGTRDRVDLVNIIDYYTKNPIAGRLSFYRNEIQSVKELCDKSPLTDTTDMAEEVVPSNLTSVPESHIEQLQQMSKKYIYIDKIDQSYLDAINVLVNCESVGIVGVGANFSVTKPVELLVLSSWSQVYILNLILCCRSGFPSDLTDLLESDYVQKVGHNLIPLMESLWHCHKVTIKNIFDIQIADTKIEADKGNVLTNPRCLSKCLNVYLDLPFLLECTPNNTSEAWSEHPLRDFQKIEASKLVTYLLTLMNIQKRLLLKEYFDPIETYLNKIHNSDCYHPRIDFANEELPSRIKEIVNSF